MSRKNQTNATRLLGVAFVTAALTAFAGLSQAQETQPSADAGQAPAKSWQTGIKRTDLVHRDLDVEGREVIQVRVDFDPGVVSPKHAHPGVEVAYVIEGTFEYELEGQPNVVLNAGESLYIPAGTAHVAKNIGKGKASELATYVVKKDTPLLILKQ
ncbi:cupin domain-containing protein [Pseudomonas izuensis]|uniref:Cupin domain-containing protein n=1 Tax=Pseudomonas izuensis TaxID=2684212 RepID=A0ABM7RT93_9PSED|nr:cupin domain-containing protein [Pseudomonas izuensis]BCX68726.1 cupin domain-containing protein [Pseudomonas izuensis]